MQSFEEFMENLPSPIEQGRQNFDALMEHGTPRQKEAVLIVLRLASLANKRGRYQGDVDFACSCLKKAWEDFE